MKGPERRPSQSAMYLGSDNWGIKGRGFVAFCV